MIQDTFKPSGGAKAGAALAELDRAAVEERGRQSEVPTELPFRGAHGLHHPDGQRGFQHGHPHVGEAEGSWWGEKGERL